MYSRWLYELHVKGKIKPYIIRKRSVYDKITSDLIKVLRDYSSTVFKGEKNFVDMCRSIVVLILLYKKTQFTSLLVLTRGLNTYRFYSNIRLQIYYLLTSGDTIAIYAFNLANLSAVLVELEQRSPSS